MYVDSVIDDYVERNDFEYSKFEYLVSISKDYRNRENLDKINDINDQPIELEEADLPF